MDLVGNLMFVVFKLKFDFKLVDWYVVMFDYLVCMLFVCDVVVSGGDVVNMLWKNFEVFFLCLFEIDNICDICLVIKVLMGFL